MNKEPPKQQITDVARKALAAYDLPPATLTFLGDSENVTFRVDVSHTSGRYLLRLHKPQRHTVETVQSEVAWLSALRAETGVVAPVPIFNQDGQTVTSLPSPKTPLCTLMEWVEGRFLGDRNRPSRAFRAGGLLARIHRHGETWMRPAGWTRGKNDAGRMDEHLSAYRRAGSEGRLTADGLVVIEETAAHVRVAMAAVGPEPDAFGLTHGDFHGGNYLFHGGEARVIDFSLCGDGYYLGDLAYALNGLHHRGAFLEGYEHVRPLSPAHRHWIETFMVLGILGETAFHLDRPQEREYLRDFLPHLVANLRDKFLKGERFLGGW